MIESLEQIKKCKEYLDYIEEHILNVNKAWEELKTKCKDMRFIYDDYVYFSIDSEIEKHDISKLSEHEFIQYRKSFYPTESEKKYDMTSAWEHHKKNNPHHWENWTEMCENGDPYAWEVHCVHMIIDWMAMGYKFNDTAEKYYNSNKEKIKIPGYAVDFIEEIFKRL